MNYRAMARAIRAERRAIWEGLGKPFVLRGKPRQHGCESYLYRALADQSSAPWRDLWEEDQIREAMVMMWSGRRSKGPTGGIYAMMETTPTVDLSANILLKHIFVEPLHPPIIEP